MSITKRNIVTTIILTIVTFGIYGIYWLIKITDEMKYASGDTELASGAKLVLLILVTCGIYGIYWAYKMGKLSAMANARYGLPAKDNSVLYLILELVGLGIVVYILVQSDLNAIADRNVAPMGPQPAPGFGAPMGPQGPQPAPGYGMPQQPAPNYGAPMQQPTAPEFGTAQPTQSTPNYGETNNGSVNSDQSNNPFNQ